MYKIIVALFVLTCGSARADTSEVLSVAGDWGVLRFTSVDHTTCTAQKLKNDRFEFSIVIVHAGADWTLAVAVHTGGVFPKPGARVVLSLGAKSWYGLTPGGSETSVLILSLDEYNSLIQSIISNPKLRGTYSVEKFRVQLDFADLPQLLPIFNDCARKIALDASP